MRGTCCICEGNSVEKSSVFKVDINAARVRAPNIAPLCGHRRRALHLKLPSLGIKPVFTLLKNLRLPGKVRRVSAQGIFDVTFDVPQP